MRAVAGARAVEGGGGRCDATAPREATPPRRAQEGSVLGRVKYVHFSIGPAGDRWGRIGLRIR